LGYIGRTPTGSILTGADIADGSISTAKLADTAVSTAKIADTAISTAKIADNAVTTTKTAFNDIPFRNRIINGDISVAQRGTSFTNVASGDYTIDRWKMNYRAIGNADISQVDNKTYKSLKVLNSNGSTQEIVMGTRIEDITQFNNDSFILSFYAKASTSCTLDTRVFENYGSGGSTTVNRVVAGSQNKTITTSRQRFTITFTASDMSSKTIGTSNFLEINFSVSLASGANWEYDSVQLEQGTSASDFEFIPFDVNFQRCQRYFTVINNNGRNGDAFFSGFTASSTAISGVGYSLATPLRIGNPTITKNSSVPMQRCTIDGFQTLSAGAGSIGLTAEAANSYMLCINLGGYSGMTSSRPAVVSFPAATNAVTIDAEL
jgi:hypothetical protein